MHKHKFIDTTGDDPSTKWWIVGLFIITFLVVGLFLWFGLHYLMHGKHSNSELYSDEWHIKDS